MRVQRVEYTTGLVAEPLKIDPQSPTGFAGGARELIVPEHNNDTYHWIAQTQQMLARGEWRVRHVDYDNAPFGRLVDSPSPYRWWLGLIAWLDHSVSGRPLGQSVERAAIFADPLLHVLLLVGAAGFVAWQFGVFPAALFAAGLAMIFPFAAAFVPGAPDDRALSLACGMGSVLPLLAGLRARLRGNSQNQSEPAGADRRATRWFLVAGIAGGLGMWVSVVSQVPILLGIALGGVIATWAARRATSIVATTPAKENRPNATQGVAMSPPVSNHEHPPAPLLHDFTSAWWAWAVAGAATILVVCLIEYYPDHLASWQLRVVHPLYGVAWLGLGAGLVQVVAWAQMGRAAWTVRRVVVFVLAIAAVAALPVVMWKLKNDGFLAAGVSVSRLVKLPGSAVASSLWAWMIRGGITATVLITVLPVLLILPAGWLILSRRTGALARSAVAIALGPVLVAMVIAGQHLSGWSMFDGVALVLLVAATDASARRPVMRWAWGAAVATMLVLGAIQLTPAREKEAKITLNEFELVGLIERDLARWLAKHAGPAGATVLAPPNETTTLYYYNGLRGLGTLARENEAGIGAAIRMVSASTPEEAKELIDRRGITHLIIPSWDSYLDDYARIGMGQLEGTFLNGLHLWRVPGWLRPVPYQLPVIAGFEGQTVTIFEVVEDQDDAVALSRTAEYFIEMNQLEPAASVAQALRRFPADLGALVARAQVELARGDTAAFAKTVELLRPRLAGNGDRSLLWDRRASLAVVLARSKQTDLARVQVQRCLTDVDEAKLRSLNTGALYRLQVLAKAFGLKITDPLLRELARDLLPDDLRVRL